MGLGRLRVDTGKVSGKRECGCDGDGDECAMFLGVDIGLYVGMNELGWVVLQCGLLLSVMGTG